MFHRPSVLIESPELLTKRFYLSKPLSLCIRKSDDEAIQTKHFSTENHFRMIVSTSFTAQLSWLASGRTYAQSTLSVWKQLKRRLVTLASSLLEHGRNKIVSVNRPSSAKMWHYLALRKSVLLPIKTASTHVTNKLPTLPIFRTVHDTSNVWPEKAFGGARTCSTLKSGNALVWNPQTGLGIKAPELRTYSILHSKRLSAG